MIVGSAAWKSKGSKGCGKGKGSRGSSDFSGMGGFDAGIMDSMMGGGFDVMSIFEAGMLYGMKGGKSPGMMSPMSEMMGGMGEMMGGKSKSSMAGKMCGKGDSKGGKFGKGGKGKGKDFNHEFLVQRVKMVQKSHDGKEKWAEFITLKGGGKRDPALRSSDELKEFLVKEDPEAYSYAGDVQLEAPTQQQKLAAQVRTGQKHSEEFKEAWWQFVAESGNQFRDPSRHEEAFLQAFLAQAPSFDVPGTRDPDHGELVARIKEGQRSSHEFKLAWQEYCNMMGQPRFDPARHDGDFIRGFLDGLGEETPAKRPRIE